ncbi:PRD domain-containing protein, partial [Lactobacillus gasseri]|nr:PRD domain-containing protein [Lactobacillus gasseri]
EYPESFVVVKEIDEQLKQDFQWEISDEEKLYLIVHIQRIYEKSSKY